MKQSGGSVWVYSEPGRGTTFKIYLPRDEGVAPAEEPAPEPAARQARGETILVVEDSDMVRNLVQKVLSRRGYTMLLARSGEEALRIAGSHEGTIHPLVTDVVMPGMGGRQVADRLRETRPATKVLFVSGYTENAIVHQGVLEAGLHFLEKPFTPQTLERKVEEILGASPPARPATATAKTTSARRKTRKNGPSRT